jgi:hypothetical protein
MISTLRLLATLSLGLALVGCGDEDSAAVPAPDTAADTAPDTTPSAPGYVALYDAYFAPTCGAAACHGGPAGIAGLNFGDPETSYERLVGGAPNMGAAASGGLSLVTPGDTAASYLFQKLTRTGDDLLAAGLGAAMPLGLAPASLEVLDAVGAWIDAGAPYDGAAVAFEETSAPTTETDQYIACEATDEAGMKDCFEAPGDPAQWMRLYTPPLSIPAGSETIMCSFLHAAEDDIRIRAATGKQMEGGHHIAIFVGLTGVPEDPVIDCAEISMGSLRFVTGAGGAGGQDLVMPDGVALNIKKGETIVIQSHYINASNEDRVVMDAIDLGLTTVEASPTLADPFSVLDTTFSIPAGAEDFTVVTECGIPAPMSIHMALGHTHDYGVLFTLDIIKGGVPEQLYYATDGPTLRDNPEILWYDQPIELVPGDTIRVTCAWTNTSDHALEFPEEMCVGLLFYSPGMGFLTCDQGEDLPDIDDGTPAGPGCVPEGHPGNELGVGKHCTKDAPQCPSPLMCLAPFDDTANYCSIILCEDDSVCGEDASCVFDGQGSACVPDMCLGD